MKNSTLNSDHPVNPKNPVQSWSILILLIVASIDGLSQKKSSVAADVYVDASGVMRWTKSKEEIHGFGINYTVPFAHAYRAARQLNVNHEKAIDDDVYHFARLGFDAYRVHVWDTEISDSVGNLITNEHLRLFDYLLMRLKERGVKIIITPIAYWGNGYPEQDEKTPGFSRKYGKDNCLVNEDAIKAQEKYLFQFLNHINPYTKKAFKDDPDIIAFEISNEPHHKGKAEEVTAFINRMVKAMRNTGYNKPIFYNVSHSIHLSDAYFNAGIQGGTFQWYPTGLGARHELRGNFLPNVDNYLIPFASNAKFRRSAKFVYEFDAADVGRSYIYPAMARSFRKAGIQIATHFAYDPTYMAYANTEYNTHYMNLVYAPQKALSLQIASEVFHRVPLYKDFGRYPLNASFDVFKVSYENDLAEMVTDEKFIYTNNTATNLSAPEKLEQISGYGNSQVVSYEGNGAYFLDKIDNGVWRLEVMPDALWVKNPFGKNSLKKEVAVVNWRTWPMTINLPDLGEDFNIEVLNDNNIFKTKVIQKSFDISPGTYLLTRKGVATKRQGTDKWKNISLKEFVAPATTLKKTYVIHSPLNEISSGQLLNIEASVISVKEPESVKLFVYTGFRPEIFSMERSHGYTYVATIPESLVREGFLRYYISVEEKDATHTYPSDAEGLPVEWDFYNDRSFEVPVVSAGNSLYIFNAMTDADELSREWRRGSVLMPGGEPNKAELIVNPEKLYAADAENMLGEKIFDYSLRYHFGKKIKGRTNELPNFDKIVLKGKALNNKSCKVQVALVTKQGTAFGGTMVVDTVSHDYSLLLSDFKKIKLVSLPRPYPTFLPYFFDDRSDAVFDIRDAETIQISIGPGIHEQELQMKHGLSIESVRLE